MFDVIYLINMLQHPKQYRFNTEAETLLKELNTGFINDLNQAILVGNVPPKKIDIAVKRGCLFYESNDSMSTLVTMATRVKH